jgi:hypothetical protein
MGKHSFNESSCAGSAASRGSINSFRLRGFEFPRVLQKSIQPAALALRELGVGQENALLVLKSRTTNAYAGLAHGRPAVGLSGVVNKEECQFGDSRFAYINHESRTTNDHRPKTVFADDKQPIRITLVILSEAKDLFHREPFREAAAPFAVFEGCALVYRQSTSLTFFLRTTDSALLFEKPFLRKTDAGQRALRLGPPPALLFCRVSRIQPKPDA